MEFSKEDVLRLYGRQLFVVPASVSGDEVLPREPVAPPVIPVPPVAVAAPAFQSGKLVVWKLKPQTRLALILHEDEFFNKNLTAALKGYINAAHIDTSLIGFGVMEGKEKEWDLREMPCPVGVIFGGGPIDAEVVSFQGKQVYPVPALAALITDPAAAQSVQELLASIQL